MQHNKLPMKNTQQTIKKALRWYFLRFDENYNSPYDTISTPGIFLGIIFLIPWIILTIVIIPFKLLANWLNN